MEIEIADRTPTSFRVKVRTSSRAVCRLTVLGPGTEGWPTLNGQQPLLPAVQDERFTFIHDVQPGGTYRVIAECDGEQEEVSITTPVS